MTILGINIEQLTTLFLKLITPSVQQINSIDHVEVQSNIKTEVAAETEESTVDVKAELVNNEPR